MTDIPISGLLKLAFKWLPSWMLRWYYSKDKLSKLVYVDIQPRGQSTVVDLGPCASVRMWLQLINLSPFPIELDRADFRFQFGGTEMQLPVLNKQVIESGAMINLSLNGPIADGHADQMHRNSSRSEGSLSGNIEFNCKVHSFGRQIRTLDGIQVTVFNPNSRAQAVA
jgi:hypothetical protein